MLSWNMALQGLNHPVMACIVPDYRRRDGLLLLAMIGVKILHHASIYSGSLRLLRPFLFDGLTFDGVDPCWLASKTGGTSYL